jgi:glycosyltransferase involved in cell wall biosynthesis
VNPRGAMPELIVEGKNGFLINSLDEMQAKLDQVDTIDRAACRQHVVDHFSVEKMTDRYVELMEEIVKGK